jgi:hypothetical protein
LEKKIHKGNNPSKFKCLAIYFFYLSLSSVQENGDFPFFLPFGLVQFSLSLSLSLDSLHFVIICFIYIYSLLIMDDDDDDERGELGVPQCNVNLSTNAVPCLSLGNPYNTRLLLAIKTATDIHTYCGVSSSFGHQAPNGSSFIKAELGCWHCLPLSLFRI